jgi:hypothetical protein
MRAMHSERMVVHSVFPRRCFRVPCRTFKRLSAHTSWRTAVAPIADPTSTCHMTTSALTCFNAARIGCRNSIFDPLSPAVFAPNAVGASTCVVSDPVRRQEYSTAHRHSDYPSLYKDPNLSSLHKRRYHR